MKKRFAALCLAVILLAIFAALGNNIGYDKIAACLSTFQFPEDFEENRLPLSKKNYEMLNDAEKQAYICVFNAIASHPEYIKIPSLSNQEFSNVFFAVKNDNPDLLCFSDSCNMIKIGAVTLLELHYDYDRQTCEEKQEALNAAVNAILAEIPSNLSEFDRELWIHDYIVTHCAYEEGENDSDAYGCLVNGKAVCSGYSRAALLLLSKVGIESVLIGGMSISQDNENVSHMWNIVWIDSQPYHLDVTWDDPQEMDESTVSHLYFNLTTQEITQDHSELSLDIVCTATENQYFRKQGLYFTDYTQETVALIQSRLLDNIREGVYDIELEFSSDEIYKAAAEALMDNQSVRSDMYAILNYLNKQVADQIDLTHVNFSADKEKRYIKLMFDTV